jgi:hypothetical protein
MQTDTLWEQSLLCVPSCICQDVYNPTDLFLCQLSTLCPGTKRQVYLNAVYSLDFGMCQKAKCLESVQIHFDLYV